LLSTNYRTWEEILEDTKLTDREILEGVNEFHVLSYDVENERFQTREKERRLEGVSFAFPVSLRTSSLLKKLA